MQSDAIELRLQRMEAFEAIRQLIAQYAIGADRKNDPAIMAPLFAPEGIWEADGLPRLVGREQIGAGLADLAREFVTWSIHYMVSPKIEVSHDVRSATCRWYLWELCTMKQDGADPADTWYGGWYDSSLSVHDGDWLFDSVCLVPRIASPAGMVWGGKSGSVE